MLNEILSHINIDELIEEHGHGAYIYRHIIANPIPLN
jgi:hypothetical protein